jgi:hypothetical protein
MYRSMLLVAISVALRAQTQTDLANMTRDLRTALERNDLAKAADMAASLNEAVGSARDAWLVRDAKTRTDEVLGYLPVDTEGFWVNQEPFTIMPDESLQLLQQQPAIAYSLDRLAVLDSGKIYRALSSRTVRMVMAATRGVRHPSTSAIPSVIGNQDIAYFYFFAEAVDLGAADERIENRPVWRGVAQIDSGEPFRPHVERTTREDENWIALAKPDLLVLSNRKALLAEILGRMQQESSTRALPPSLPEWQEVARDASFWGLRHYTEVSRPKQGESGFEAAELPQPDGSSVGATVRLDSKSRSLEIRYLSDAPLAKRPGSDSITNQFQIDQPHSGVWRLVSNLQERGPFPAHIAFIMLGFGEYR